MNRPLLAPAEVRLAAVADRLALPVTRVTLHALPDAGLRTGPWHAPRERIDVDGEPRYCLRWLAKDHPVGASTLATLPALFSRATRLRTPLFIARVPLLDWCGLLEEWIVAETFSSLHQKGHFSALELESRVGQAWSAMLAAPAADYDARPADRQRCRDALRWVGEGSADYRELLRLVDEAGDALFSPVTRLIHEDLVPSNLLALAAGLEAVVDFEHCRYSSIPWYAAWRLHWFAGIHIPGEPAPGSVLHRFAILLEVERQHAVLTPARFLHDWRIAWRQALLSGREGVPGAASELARIEQTVLGSP